MKISIFCISKTKEKSLIEWIDKYKKRLKRYCNIEIIELPDVSVKKESVSEIEYAKKEESLRLMEKGKDYFTILLDVEGKSICSKDFSKLIQETVIYKNSKIAFLIGGAYGVSDELKNYVDYKLSISKMTFTHQMIRIILLEQIYRAFKIKEGSKYHK